MSIRIEIKKDETELSYKEYSFILLDETLWLDAYTEWSRDTQRKKFVRGNRYYRLSERDSNLKLSEVELTEEIKQQALYKLMERIAVNKWNGR